MRSLSALALVALAATLARAQPAPSRPRSIAIVALEIGGDAAPELREPVQKSVLGALTAAGVHATSHDSAVAALAGSPELVGCVSTTCLERMSEKLGVSELLRGRVEGDGTNYAITLELLSPGAQNGVVRRLEDTCPVCTISDLDARLADLTKRLVSETTVELTDVVIASSPAGAALTVDGQAVGTAPFSGRLTQGDHHIHAVLAGRGSVDQVIAVDSGGTEARRFELALPALELARPQPTPDRPYRAWKWLGAGGSVALLAVGVSLLAIDGDPTCGDLGGRECKTLRDTRLAGWLGVAGGVVVGGLTGWMFYRDQHDQAAHLELSPRDDGATVGLDVRF